MAQRMDAQGSGDPFAEYGGGNDINMLRTAADGLKLVAGGMRKQRLDALEADLEYQERKARKANKKAFSAYFTRASSWASAWPCGLPSAALPFSMPGILKSA